MRKTGQFIILGITIAVTLYVFAGIIYFRPQAWNKALAVTPVAQAPAQVPTPAPALAVKPAEAMVPAPAPVPAPKPAEAVVLPSAPAVTPALVTKPTQTSGPDLVLSEQEQAIRLGEDLGSLGTSALDPLSLNKPLGDLKDLSGVKDSASSIGESIALSEQVAKPIVPATAPDVTMTVRPVMVPVIESAPVLEPIAPLAEAAPIEEPIVVEAIVAEAEISEPLVVEPVALESVTLEPAVPEPVVPLAVLVPGPPIVTYTVRSISPALVEELKFLWTPTVMPEGPAVHVDPMSYSTQASELRKNAVDQILDNLTWE